jgi:hypothetical protein
VERRDGKLVFGIESGAHGLKRIVARFEFARARSLAVEAERFNFRRRESIRLFFSYRHTPERIHALFGRHGFRTRQEWVIPSGEEGVFLCQRA